MPLFRFLFYSMLAVLPAASLRAQSGRETVIEYRLENGQYYACIHRDGGVSCPILLCDETDLAQFPADHHLYESATARKVYDLLLEPISGFLRRRENVYFSPAGRIHFINLAALMTPGGKRCCELYRLIRISSPDNLPEDRPKLLDRCELILFGGMNYRAEVTSMRDHAWWLHTDDFKARYLDSSAWDIEDISFGYAEDGTRAGADNLTESRGEIKFIYQLRKTAHVNTGAEALEERFRFYTNSSQDYVMHLSTHTFTLEPKDSLLSARLSERQRTYKSCGLLFSGAGHTLDGKSLPYGLNDGLLYAEEIAGLNMSHCRLLVLGACNTALGTVTQDGVIGLQSAFKEAGVSSMLMTLWSVNDKATSEFMKRFYTYLYSGKSRHESLNRARIDLMHSKDFSAPIYWAPFILLD